ncbi:MAG: endonuclease/exonuclease/phosphatase family protein [Thermomicrobiales bacterium]
MKWAAGSGISVPYGVWVVNRFQFAIGAMAAVLTLVLNLQSQRVFVPTMLFVVDQSNRQRLMAYAAIVFLAIALVGAIALLTDVRVAASSSVLLLAASRLIVQFTENPDFRWVVAAAGVVASGWLLILFLLVDRSAFAIAIPAAFWIDITLRASFETIDLAFMTTATKDVLTVVLVIVTVLLVLAMRWPRYPSEQPWVASLPLVSLGPGLAAFALVSGNLGLAAIMTGNDLPANYWLLSIGPIAAFAYWSSAGDATRRGWHIGARSFPAMLLIAALGAVGFVGIWSEVESDFLGGIALAMFSASSIILLMTSVAGCGTRRAIESMWRTVSLVTAGLCLHAAVIFLYFASSGSHRYLLATFTVLGTTALLTSRRPRTSPVDHLPTRAARPVFIVVTIVLAFVMASAGREEPFTIDLGEEITIVTYNIQNGFSRENIWDLEATARTIESLQPDIVLLQETGRGWFAMGWADQVWWLSDRLGMDFAFGGVSHDGLWGNAVLSAASMLDTDVVRYTSTQNLNRGVVSVEIPVPTGTLSVFATHLDNPSGAGEVRIEQASQLLEQWGGVEPAIIGGDFNARPDADVISTMVEAGFVDGAAAAGEPSSTSETGNRIDYLFVTPDITVLSADAPDVWTSDHRPLRVELSLAPE